MRRGIDRGRPCMRSLLAGVAILAAACGDPILEPGGEPVELSAETLRGRWEEAATIYANMERLADTVAVDAANAIIYEFELEGAGSARRVQPNPRLATYSIVSNGAAIQFNAPLEGGYGVWLTTRYMTITTGNTTTHVFPGRSVPEVATRHSVYRRVGDATHR